MADKILVVEDDQVFSALVATALRKFGFDVLTLTNAPDAIQTAQDMELSVIVTDVHLGDVSGIELCRSITTDQPDLPIIIMTAHGDMETAISAVRAGAYDFINKPFKMDALHLAVQRAVRHHGLCREVKSLRDEVRKHRPIETLVGESRPMQQVYELVNQVADIDMPVLVDGESGTGKELVARAIHERSHRKGPFVAINCAAIPGQLLESELFGHVKGAFTDAKQSHTGLFVQASGGTLFLDEIGEMPLEMQVKLLRVLQERKVRPVGGSAEIEFDIRIISATNRDLETEIEEKNFRQDLYYRLNVVRIEIPPLRSRGHDILLLAQHFLEHFAARANRAVVGISPPAAKKLLAYDWPGNVRELENCMARAVTLTQVQEIEVHDLPDKIRDHVSTKMIISSSDPAEMPTLQEVEQRYIQRVLEAVQGNKSAAARVLGLGRRTLYRKLDQLSSPPETTE